ncbi:MAG: T9SS type A sorting domain-containing protein, partial [Ignavibacteriaceae bacterium]
NPFHDKIRITSEEAIYRLEVFDLTGKLIVEKSIQNQKSSVLNLEGLPGSAILRATFKNGNSQKMVVVKQ